jgi:CRISPR/Cas system CSM-associated protein Csm2 small subunit
MSSVILLYEKHDKDLVSPAEVIILSVAKGGLNSNVLFQADGVDRTQLLSVIKGLKSSGYLEETQNTGLSGTNEIPQYVLTYKGEQKLVNIANQLSETWNQIVTAMDTDNSANNIAAFVKLVSDNEQWIYVMVILGLVTEEAVQEIFNTVNMLTGKDEQKPSKDYRLHRLVKDSVDNYVGLIHTI